ncbi:retrotransposon protein, putative, ty1-copia subclass [Tanacetum coccineum]
MNIKLSFVVLVKVLSQKINSTKSMLGHLVGASGAVETMSSENGVNPPAPNPSHNSSFSLLSVLGRERLTGPNYMDWMRNLRFTLRYENKEYVLDEQIPIINDNSTQDEIEAHQKYYDDVNKVSCIMASSMSPELQKTFEFTWAYEMNQQLKEMFQAKASKERLDVVKSLMACKPKPGASICAFVLEMKGYFNRLESLNMVFDAELSINIILFGLPADYNQFVLSYQMNGKETSIMELHSLLQTVEQGIKKIDVPYISAASVLTVGHNAKKRKTSHSNWKGKPQKESPIVGLRESLNMRLHLLVIQRKQCASTATRRGIGSVAAQRCGTYICTVLQDLKESRKLKHGELNLVMGNRKITHVTKIGKYELMLKYGVRINLNNCCYSSEMTRNIISFHALFKDGYQFSFDNENGDILVYLNGCFMFKASPCNGIYETVECIDNGNVILNVGSSNELDKSKLWHSRLGHINKKRIAQLQKDGVLESFDFKSDDVCESCLLGKMTKSPFTGTCERGEGLLDLVHTDVCGPFQSATKDGKRYYCSNVSKRSREPTGQKDKARRGVFLEREMISKEDSRSKIDLEEIQESVDEEPIVNTDSQQEVVTPVEPNDVSLPIRRTSRVIAKIKSIRIMLAIVAFHDYEIWQMDVKTAFLNGKLTEDVFMAQPEGFENAKYPKRVCKLQKAIYGLKQASRSWNLCFHEKVTQFGFSRSEDESCIYVKISGSIVVFLVLYVDDILHIGNDIPILQSVKDWLGKCFVMKDLGDAAYILGIKIYRDMSKRLIGLSQDTYLDKILKRFKMDNSKKGNLPLHDGIKISSDLCPKTNDELDKMSRVPYASAIGSIMYAMTCTRPDVSFDLSMVSRHQQNPGEGHWTAVKNILKYLRNTKDRFLVYGGEKELRVTGYSDAGWQTDKDDSRSQSGWIFLQNGGAASKEAIWMKNFIGDLGVVPTVQDPIEIFCDNESAVALTKEPKDHGKSKHIDRKYHFVRSKVAEGHVIVKDIRSEDNPADPFTKALAKSKHDEHAWSIGLKDKIKF